MKTLSVLIALFTAVLARSADAAPILDVEYDGGSGGFASTSPLGQTFTINTSGILTQLAVELVTVPTLDGPMPVPATLDVQLFSTSGGVPSSLLQSAVINTASLSGAPTFFLSTLFAVPVLAGDVLAVVLPQTLSTTSPQTGAGWTYGFTPYSGGASFAFNGSWLPSGDNDRSFRVYVDPDATAVVEPATLTLLGTGAVGVLARRRRRKQQ